MQDKIFLQKLAKILNTSDDDKGKNCTSINDDTAKMYAKRLRNTLRQ